MNYNKLATSSINGQLDDTSIIVGEKITDSDSPNVHEAPKMVIHRQALSKLSGHILENFDMRRVLGL